MTKNSPFPTVLATLVVALMLGASAASAADAKPDGKALFTTFKCSSCHAVKAQGIAVVKEEGEESEDAEETAKTEDLSDVGSRHDAKWITGFLSKKIELEGKTHRKKFPGTPAEMDVLATWLASLKKAP